MHASVESVADESTSITSSTSASEETLLTEKIRYKCFDSKGGLYHDTTHDIIIRVPEGAIPENRVIELEVEATLTSTLKLPEGYRSISVCVLKMINILNLSSKLK